MSKHDFGTTDNYKSECAYLEQWQRAILPFLIFKEN